RGKSEEARGKRQEARGKRQEARGKSEEARVKSEESLGDFTFLYTVWFYCVHLLRQKDLLPYKRQNRVLGG
ncbi:hypothetical protein QHH11_09615, partial [Aphanizomenon sp. PH219]|nr:hypothetical protein [Aphanizomenon sp. PH219]